MRTKIHIFNFLFIPCMLILIVIFAKQWMLITLYVWLLFYMAYRAKNALKTNK